MSERDYNEEYEKLAKEFHEKTGLMAPGKDISPAEGHSKETDYDYRLKEWTKFLKEHTPDPEGGEDKNLSK